LSPGGIPVMLTRLWDQMSRVSINKSATELFYFPLEPAMRRHAKAVIEAGLERLGDGVAAILILLITFFTGFASPGATPHPSARTMGIMIAAVVVVWILALLRMRPGYTRQLERNLRRLLISHADSNEMLHERALLKETVRLLDAP